MIEHSKDQEW